MPELPEVEHLRRTLEPVLIGGRVSHVRLHRPDVVRDAARGRSRAATTRRITGATLLSGATIVELKRHGKQLALISNCGRVLGVHLGMTGQLRHLAADQTPVKLDHVHCQWTIASGRTRSTLVFRDPRRFGGLWTARTLAELQRSCWAGLGPDALAIPAEELDARLKRTQRAIKAALLDQTLIAGLGNIYVDEALHTAGIDPRSRAARLSRSAVLRLHTAIITVLHQAIDAGGTSMRDYLDSNGAAGGYLTRHRAYGRAGQPCLCCAQPLVRIELAQRGTTFCRSCQRRYR